MTPEEFVQVVVRVVYEAAPRDVARNLEQPPGRAPSPRLQELSRWYVGLNERDRAMVGSLMRAVADSAVFGFFAVLDGARAISDGGSENLVLEVHGPDGSVRLNSPSIDLHDLYRGIVQPQLS